MSESDEEFNDETLWETELEIALLTKCDYGAIRSISKLRPIPEGLRTKVWKVCLDVQQDIEDNEISKWKEEYDLPQQNKIREECKNLAEKLYPDDAEKQLMATGLAESILTYYCKSNDESFEKDNGWLEILFPVLSLNLNKNESYNFFQSILKRYIPKDCVPNGSPYHLFRLLMLYHDPELCAYLDTRKISPDSYAHLWFRSLFSANTNLNVIFHLWDMYFQLGDQFLVFFMSLILVFNIREEIMSSQNMDKAELIKLIQSSPTSLDAGDLFDFNGLCQHFAAKTPQSFRKEYKKPLFEGISLGKKASSIYQALCLPVSVDELLQANQLGSGVRYFIIDCRPAEKYNASHYATAFHLDANLMLENPAEFNQSVEALLAAQKQAINAGSVAGGQHLCFMGTGIDEEDKYVNMVVSNFLQRKINFVSLALGGYEELRTSIEDPEMIVGTDVQATSSSSRAKFTEEWVKKINAPESTSTSSMFNKFSNVFKFKSGDIKGKLKDYVLTPLNNTATAANNNKQIKHVSASDKIGKLYRNQGNLFAIDDTNDDELNEPSQNGGMGGGGGNGSGGAGESNNPVEYVNLKVWLERPDVISKFNCFYRDRKDDGKIEWVPGYLLLTKTHLYGLTQKSSKKSSAGMVEITVRHPLNSIIKIATKSTCPEIISFTYGEKIDKPASKSSSVEPAAAVAAAEETTTTTARTEESLSTSSSITTNKESKPSQLSDYAIKGKEWFYVPEYSGEAASAVKRQILEIADLIH